MATVLQLFLPWPWAMILRTMHGPAGGAGFVMCRV